MPIPRASAVVKKMSVSPFMIMKVVAVFGTREAAEAWKDNANEWYGKDHPLYPLTVVDDILDEPRPFPVEAMRKLRQ
jgi:hypothetical protein